MTTETTTQRWTALSLGLLSLSLGLLTACAEDKGGGPQVVNPYGAYNSCAVGQISYGGTCIQQNNACGPNGGYFNGGCVVGVPGTGQIGVSGGGFYSATAFTGSISVTNPNVFARLLSASRVCQENAVQPVWGGIIIGVGNRRCHFFTSGGAISIDFGNTQGLGFGVMPPAVNVTLAAGPAIGGQVNNWGHYLVAGNTVIASQGQLSVSPRNSNSGQPSFVATATTGHPYAVGAFEIESQAVNLSAATQFAVVLKYSGQVFASAVVQRQVGNWNSPHLQQTGYPGAPIWGQPPGIWQPRPFGI